MKGTWAKISEYVILKLGDELPTITTGQAEREIKRLMEEYRRNGGESGGTLHTTEEERVLHEVLAGAVARQDREVDEVPHH